ncbi:hypothetical protein [Aggregatilinea lenta]|uniref:hypothetical protein n=1 Tax=Aggregatilinea lenta TaxID=913108 RepID=UPI000E5BC7FF|nr:hypothetical protein [Aggregatilinea lenta]
MPESVIPLYEQGKRVRYNGFWLNASDRDRRVAEIIDAFPQDVSEWVKDFLATLHPLLSEDPEGAPSAVRNFLRRKPPNERLEIAGLDELRQTVLEIHAMLRSGKVSTAPPAEDADDEVKDRVEGLLGKLRT